MSQLEKVLKKLYSLPKEMRYEELKNILERYGFVGTECGSSHITYRRDGYPNITIPRHGNINKVYVKLVRDAIAEVMKNVE